MKTAIEYLFEEFFKVKWDCMQGNKPIIFEQAKAIEKEQIKKANLDGYKEGCTYHSFDHRPITSEEYYNQTYNQNEI
jgi:hypothetical protein